MTLDLDQLADRTVDYAPTKVPSIETVRRRARQRQRRTQLLGLAVILPVVVLFAVAVWAPTNEDAPTELVVTDVAPSETETSSDEPVDEGVPTESEIAPTTDVTNVRIPDVIGLASNDAAIRLDRAGFEIEIVVSPTPLPDVAPGVVFATDPVAGAPIAPGSAVIVTVTRSPVCGDSLPVDVEFGDPSDQRMNELSVNERLDFLQQITLDSGEELVVRWPAEERVRYGLEDGIPLFFPARLEIAGDAGGGAAYSLTGLDEAEATIGSSVLLVVPPDVSSATSVQPGCEVVEFTVTNGDDTAIFGWNLTHSGWRESNGATGFPLVNLAPLVTSTEEVADGPTAIVGCNTDRPTAETTSEDRFETPVDALHAFLDTEPAETFIKSGFHEMIAPDGSTTFGILSHIPARAPLSTDDFVTLITAAESDEGWQIVSWTSSTC